MKLLHKILVQSTTFCLFSAISLLAEDIDPSNPTQLNTSINPIYEHQSFNAEGEPSYHNDILKVEAQMSGPGMLLLAEVGYGKNSFTDKSNMVDSRFRFFHLPYSNETEGALVNALGWSIDTFIPTGDYDEKLGSGAWTFSPGVITAHNFSWGALYPNLMYQYTVAEESSLKDSLRAQGLDDSSQAVRFDLHVSPKMPAGWWLMLSPSFTTSLKNADDGASLKVFTGFFISEKQAIGLESEYSFKIVEDRLNYVQNGQEVYVKVMYQHYF